MEQRMKVAPRKAVFRWVFALVVPFVITVLLLECVLPFFDERVDRYFRAPAFQPTFSEASQFLKSPRFDPTLGWGGAPIRDLETTKVPLAQAYGDSFVHASDDADSTWESAFEKITGKAILNYGQGGYGLDQAVLKFERYRDAHPTRLAILGLYSEEMRRARSYYAYTYFTNHLNWRYAFKPFFAPDGRSFRLVPQPCVDAQCLVDSVAGRNAEVNRVLEEFDYWYRLDRARPPLVFPRSWNYARALFRAITDRGRSERDESVFVDPIAADLAEYLTKRFADEARRAGMVPVCLFLYNANELANLKRGVRRYERLREFLSDEGIATIDTGPYIVQSLPSETTFKRITVPDGHMNREGNRLIAEALARGLGRLGLL
jgi:hypothetical protein